MIIYKILTTDQWEALQRERVTKGAPVDMADGFIHFSTADQCRETAARHFTDQEGLFLLAYQADRKAGRPGQARTLANDLIPASATEHALEYPVTTEIPLSDPAYNEALSAFYAECTKRLRTLTD
ncbi:MAG: DUF952 domain-containing protein, partial [Pseudomonadota bacterium]